MVILAVVIKFKYSEFSYAMRGELTLPALE